MLLDHDPNKNY